MKNPTKYFFILSIILLTITGILLFRESRPEWKQFQKDYRAHLINKATTPADKAQVSQFDIGIKQHWIPDLDRADRCRSCHVGVDDPSAPAKSPLTSHPDISPHTFEKFGCTICHEGDGLATRLPDAHVNLVPGRLIEASCGKCHGLEGPVIEEAPTYNAGYKLLEDKACAGCHLLSGESKKEFHGPSLLGINSKVSRDWLIKWLKSPNDYLPASRMANFLLDENEVDALANFLLSQNLPAETAEVFYQSQAAEQEIMENLTDDELDELYEQGKTVFGRMRCLSCHSLNGKGGSIGPELSKISRKTNRAWMSAWIKSPSTFNIHTRMPIFHMTTMERLGLLEYLIWESEPEELDEDAVESSFEQKTKLSDGKPLDGQDIFQAKGCVNCHQLPGVKANPDFAPPLKDLADKKVEKIDFGKTDIPHTLPDYIAVKLQRPRVFGDKLKMPDFEFSPEETGRLTTALLGRTSSIPASYQWRKQAPDANQPAGEVGAIFERFKCLECHRMGDKGGTLAPDLTFEGSKVRKGWLKSYLEKPYAIRPYLVERMPRFNMSVKEAETLADYIDLVLRNNTIDAASLSETGSLDAGRRLYFDKYACQSCHSIDGEGGYYGPALENVAQRLKSAWLDTRLVNSHPYEPGAREPALIIQNEDRADLLAYLSTLQVEEKP
jgi:mono/diheme cytochrome c family protein